MIKQQKIYIAGHRGMVGSAIIRELEAQGHKNFVTRTHAELDLTNQSDVRNFFESEKPEQVYLPAAKVIIVNMVKVMALITGVLCRLAFMDRVIITIQKIPTMIHRFHEAKVNNTLSVIIWGITICIK